MNELSMLQSNLQARITSRSMGVKLIVVCGLALFMTIPALFVEGVLQDRKNRAADVTREISSHVGGQQTFLGPTLAIPYSVPAQSQTDAAKYGMYLVFPAQAWATLKTSTEERRRSLFRVPVFQADMKFDSQFDLSGVPAAVPQGAVLDWNRAEIVVGVSDARGALADALLTIDGKTLTLVPATVSERISIGEQGQQVNLTLFGAKAGEIAKPGAQFKVGSSLKFSGAQRIAVLAYGKTTHVTAQGDWASPGFDGGFLPVSRRVESNGFAAEWSVPFIARGVRAEGRSDSISGLDATALGISFVEVADPYQSVNRSLKYVPLFLGLLFLSYFIFEVTTGKRVHPAQYILVGIAQIIFYLLLLSLAERIGFDFGFLVAGSATVILLAANAGWIFASRAHGARALVIFSLLYGLIFMLLRLEDNALLVGAIASFAAVAAAMYFTRFIDWYSSIPVAGAAGQGSPSQVPKETI
ncbi:MAG TPA: cell envelope integrity protein CreD [Terracidiphilus sp.]|jgi:inner membrane protein|nr:cell envelope integrity protein CreD [Terracidiphilus sp.]